MQKKNFVLICSYLTRARALTKKIAKNSKKKKIIMALFLAKPDHERPRKSKKKKFRSVPTRHGLEHSKKNSKKTKKQHFGSISSQTGSGQAENEKRKFVPIRSYSNRARAFPKK